MNLAYAADFQLTSSAFQDGDTIPVKYTCSDIDVSPPFAWKGAPAKTQSFALICEDPDADAVTLQKNMQGHIIEAASVTGLFNR